MPRKPSIVPLVRVEVHIPVDLLDQFDRAPGGNRSDKVVALMRRATSEQGLELSPYGLPVGFRVHGSPVVLDILREHLERIPYE